MSEKSAREPIAAALVIVVYQDARIDFHVHQFFRGSDNFGKEAASWLLEHLRVVPECILKTLTIKLSGKRAGLAIAVVPTTGTFNLKAVTAAVGASKATTADPRNVSLATGHVPSGIPPLGGRRKLPTAVDKTATLADTMFASGGHRG